MVFSEKSTGQEGSKDTNTCYSGEIQGYDTEICIYEKIVEINRCHGLQHSMSRERNKKKGRNGKASLHEVR